MNTTQIFDNRLRPVVEFVPAFFSLGAAALLVWLPNWFLPILSYFAWYTIIGLIL